MGFAPQRCAIFRHLKFKKWSENVFFLVHFDSHMCFFEIGTSKMARECGVLRIFTYKCASRHSGVPFFQIGTSKMAPSIVLRILTCKCASRHSGVPFSRSELPKWFRACGVLCTLTSKCASRHSGVPFFISPLNTSAPAALASLLFEHQEPRIIEKTQRFATFLTFRAVGSSF